MSRIWRTILHTGTRSCISSTDGMKEYCYNDTYSMSIHFAGTKESFEEARSKEIRDSARKPCRRYVHDLTPQYRLIRMQFFIFSLPELTRFHHVAGNPTARLKTCSRGYILHDKAEDIDKAAHPTTRLKTSNQPNQPQSRSRSRSRRSLPCRLA